jgi:hypothetical protein
VVTRRTRLDRVRAAAAAVAAVAAAPPKEVWLPAKDGGGDPPGRYPHPGGRLVVVVYDPTDPNSAEGPA